MINPKAILTVKHDENGTFNDYTAQAKDYLRDPFTIALASSTDYLYIGLYKPFKSMYVELSTPNTTPNELSAEIFVDGAWQSAEISDETNGLTRSGFLIITQGEPGETTVDGTVGFYVRLRPSQDHVATEVRGINLVFADDASLKQEFLEIDNENLLPPGESSHIGSHIAARNHIMQKLRDIGYIKRNDQTGYEDITQFDLLDIFEIKQAAVYFALSRIFFNLSDNPEDHWWVKYRDYQDLFEKTKWPARLTVDTDDDGVVDNNEKKAQRRNMRFTR